MKVYKATDKDIKCRGFQFTPGVEAVEEKAELCESGFHACERPLDVLNYYAPGDGSRYFEAELEDVSPERHPLDTKVCGKRIKLGAEIGIPGLVKAQIEYVKAHTTTEHTDPERATAGDSGAATAGYSGAATAGDSGAATAGYYGAATAGNYGAATSRGKSASGVNGLSVVRGTNVMAKGGMGAVIVIAVEYDDSYDVKEWKAGVIDGENLKPDTWYKLENGEFVEAADG